jgi:hypothetical protein
MAETLIWVGGLVIEALIVAAAVLTALLRRSRKAQQQLLARLAEMENMAAEFVTAKVRTEAPKQTSAEAVAEIQPAQIDPVEKEKAAVEAVEIGTVPLEPPIDAVRTERPDAVAEPAMTAEVSTGSEFDRLREIVNNANLDKSTERLQQRLDLTNDSLQRLALDLEQDPTASGTAHLEIATIQSNLQELTSEVGSLQDSSARLQQSVRDKTHVIEQTFVEQRAITERELHQAKELRRDMTALLDKLKSSEGDVQKLQAEKQALAAEYAELNREYERIYASSEKKKV